MSLFLHPLVPVSLTTVLSHERDATGPNLALVLPMNRDQVEGGVAPVMRWSRATARVALLSTEDSL